MEEEYIRDHSAGLSAPRCTMRAVYHVIESAARPRHRLHTGESGTGKELCAEAIHSSARAATGRSSRSIAARSRSELMESEMFGHVKGAFTGAVGDRDGAIARRSGGTLLLDEICEMDWRCRSNCCGCCNRASSSKVGGSEVERADVRYRVRHQPRPVGRGAGRPVPRGSVTTGCTSCRARCRRCASATTTCCCWRAISPRFGQRGRKTLQPTSRRCRRR